MRKFLMFLTVLFVIITASLYLYVNKNKEKKVIEYKLITNDKLVGAHLIGDYECDKKGFCYDDETNITNYVVNYKKSDFNNNLNDVIKKYVENASINYKTFEEVTKPISYSLENRTLLISNYKAVMDDVDYIFLISAVAYKDSDIYSLVVFVTSELSYESNKTNLLKSVESFYPIKKSN